VGSIRFDLKPTPALRFKYLFKPNFTLVRRTNSLSYNNRTDEYELNWAPFRELSTGLTYRLGSSLTIDKTDYPDLKREKDRSDTKTTLITLKMAPHRIISNELNYLVEDILGSTLSSDAVSYLKTSGSTKKFDAILRTSLAERISVDTTYTFEKVDQLSDISTSNILTQTHTASIKGLWDINENWSVSASSAYSRKLDLLATASPETYTFSPGAGFIFRWGRELRVDANYTFSKSYAGATTEKYKWSLQGRYDMYENVHLTLRFEQEISHAPDYKSTDFMGNLEITL